MCGWVCRWAALGKVVLTHFPLLGGAFSNSGARPGLYFGRVKGALLLSWAAGPSRGARCSSVERGDWPLFGQLFLWRCAPLHSIWCTGRDGPVRWEGAGRSLLGAASRALSTGESWVRPASWCRGVVAVARGGARTPYVILFMGMVGESSPASVARR